MDDQDTSSFEEDLKAVFIWIWDLRGVIGIVILSILVGRIFGPIFMLVAFGLVLIFHKWKSQIKNWCVYIWRYIWNRKEVL